MLSNIKLPEKPGPIHQLAVFLRYYSTYLVRLSFNASCCFRFGTRLLSCFCFCLTFRLVRRGKKRRPLRSQVRMDLW